MSRSGVPNPLAITSALAEYAALPCGPTVSTATPRPFADIPTTFSPRTYEAPASSARRDSDATNATRSITYASGRSRSNL